MPAMPGMPGMPPFGFPPPFPGAPFPGVGPPLPFPGAGPLPFPGAVPPMPFGPVPNVSQVAPLSDPQPRPRPPGQVLSVAELEMQLQLKQSPTSPLGRGVVPPTSPGFAPVPASPLTPGCPPPSGPAPPTPSLPAPPMPPQSPADASSMPAGYLAASLLAAGLPSPSVAPLSTHPLDGQHIAPAALQLTLPREKESTAQTTKVVAPFTQAHRKMLPSAGASHPLEGCSAPARQFLRAASGVERPPQHEGFMSNSDKDLIVKIQLSQMAAMGTTTGEVKTYRMPKDKRHDDAPSTPSGSSPKSAAGALVTRLQATISAAADAEEGQAESPSESSSAQRSDRKSPKEKSPNSVDDKFGGHTHASVLHPRPIITIPTESATAAGESEDRGGYWRTLAALERAYSSLLDLEQLTFKLSESTKDDDEKKQEKQGKLLQERGDMLERVASLLLDPAEPSGEDVGEKGIPLTAFLSFRKGRILLHRLLACLGQTGEQIPSKAPAYSLLWRCVLAVLCMPCVLLALASAKVPPRGSAGVAGHDPSWQKLRLSLVRSLKTACAPGVLRPGSQAEALTVILNSHTGSRLSTLLMTKQGLQLLRLLVDGCREPAGAPVEASGDADVAREAAVTARGSFIEAICTAVPFLFQVAASQTVPERSLSGEPLERLPDGVELLTQEELWAMLIALTEQATARQKKHMSQLIGTFLSKVNAQPAQGGASAEAS